MRRLITLALVALALAASSVALAASGLTGTFRAHVTSSAEHGSLKGTWTLKFRNGVMAAAKNARSQGSDRFSIKGSIITFRPVPGCARAGSYRFKLTGTTLKFARIKDTCKYRSVLLSFTYTKVG